MIENMNKKNIFVIAVFVFSSCIPICDSKTEVGFRNCTGDTIYVGISSCNNFDSIYYQLSSTYEFEDSVVDYNSGILINDYDFYRHCVIAAPDSLCFFADSQLFVNSDTSYFFLIKYRDTKIYSWDEIRAKKLYGRCIVTRNTDGEFDRNIQYMK